MSDTAASTADGPTVIREMDPKLLVLDADVQPREKLTKALVDEYATDMMDGDVFPAVVVYFDGKVYRVADGFRRTSAAIGAGLDSIKVEVRRGEKRDAILYASGCNATHGKPRSNKDKRRAVEVLLKDAAWQQQSNAWIAQHCKVSDRFVGKVRAELSPNGSEMGSTRTVTRGGKTFKMNTANIGSKGGDDQPQDDGDGEAPEPDDMADLDEANDDEANDSEDDGEDSHDDEDDGEDSHDDEDSEDDDQVDDEDRDDAVSDDGEDDEDDEMAALLAALVDDDDDGSAGGDCDLMVDIRRAAGMDDDDDDTGDEGETAADDGGNDAPLADENNGNEGDGENDIDDDRPPMPAPAATPSDAAGEPSGIKWAIIRVTSTSFTDEQAATVKEHLADDNYSHVAVVSGAKETGCYVAFGEVCTVVGQSGYATLLSGSVRVGEGVRNYAAVACREGADVGLFDQSLRVLGIEAGAVVEIPAASPGGAPR